MITNPILHIVACSPRSGTTLFHEAMTTCFNTELHYAHEKSIFRAEVAERGLSVTKDPNEIFYMKALLQIEPRLHVVYISRDPRDVISSIHKGREGGGYFRDIRTWVEYQTAFSKIKKHPRVCEIKYEDLVSDPDSTQNHLMSKFPFLIKKYSFSEFHLHADPTDSSSTALNGLRPFSSTSTGSWKKHLPRVKAQLQVYPNLPTLLIDLDYEGDSSWLSFLDNIDSSMEINTHFHSIVSFKIKYKIFRKCLWYFLARTLPEYLNRARSDRDHIKIS